MAVSLPRYRNNRFASASVAASLCALLAWSQTTGCAVSANNDVSTSEQAYAQLSPTQWQKLVETFTPIATVAHRALQASEDYIPHKPVAQARQALGPLLYFLYEGKPIANGMAACQWLIDRGIPLEGLPYQWQVFSSALAAHRHAYYASGAYEALAEVEQDYNRIRQVVQEQLRANPVRFFKKLSALIASLQQDKAAAIPLGGGVGLGILVVIALLLLLVAVAIYVLVTDNAGKFSFNEVAGAVDALQPRAVQPPAAGASGEEQDDVFSGLLQELASDEPVYLPEEWQPTPAPHDPAYNDPDQHICASRVEEAAATWALFHNPTINTVIYCYADGEPVVQRQNPQHIAAFYPNKTTNVAVYNVSPHSHINVQGTNLSENGLDLDVRGPASWPPDGYANLEIHWNSTVPIERPVQQSVPRQQVQLRFIPGGGTIDVKQYPAH